MPHISNNTNISLAMAVWLATNGYNSGADEAPEGEMISATTLLKPTRQFILSQDVTDEDQILDVTDLIASRLGHAIHESIESSWKNNYRQAMESLGYAPKIIDKVLINPSPEELKLKPDAIPVHTEKRGFREFDGVIVTGQLDLAINGSLNDTKSTSVFTYLNGSKTEDYRIQGSIYRWLFPEMITNDVMYIQLFFTDWSGMMKKQNPKYPPHRIHEFKINLMTLEETEIFIKNKLTEIRNNIGIPQSEMIRCTDEQLWRTEPQYKYYSNPESIKKGSRSTKNFGSMQEAVIFKDHEKDGKGEILFVPGKVKACGYCKAFTNCQQKDEYEHD